MQGCGRQWWKRRTPVGTWTIPCSVQAARTSPVRIEPLGSANTEDFALGGYRDRLRLVLRDEPRSGAVLVAANTGAPLTAAGVESLAALRAGRPE